MKDVDSLILSVSASDILPVLAEMFFATLVVAAVIGALLFLSLSSFFFGPLQIAAGLWTFGSLGLLLTEEAGDEEECGRVH